MVITDPFAALGLEFDKAFAHHNTTAYPPYNVVKIDDDKLVMEFAVAGFTKEDISITTEKNILSVVGERAEDSDRKYLHKGIAGRKFSRKFQLPEYFEVDNASYGNGILAISLIRNIPEEKKPKQIAIS